MGALPKRKPSTRRQGKRRSQIKLKLKNLSLCPHCGSEKLSHQICPQCGAYK
jgi:large subunit ribosomal protein L32